MSLPWPDVVHRRMIPTAVLTAMLAAVPMLTACRDDGNDQGIRLQQEQQRNDRLRQSDPNDFGFGSLGSQGG